MTKEFTEPLRNKIKELIENASNLELIANDLDNLRVGELIGVEYEKEDLYPLYVGNYEGVMSDNDGLKIKLGNFAFIASNIFSNVDEYKLCNSREHIKIMKEICPISTQLFHGRSPTESELEKAGDILYPTIHDELNIIKESEINQSLQKYGFSMEDYKVLFQKKK